MNNLSRYYYIVLQLLKSNPNSVLGQLISEERLESYVYSHDNWNGGIDIYRITLKLPVSDFIRLKSSVTKEKAEKELLEAFSDSIGKDDSIQIDSVEIIPSEKAEKIVKTTDASFWVNGYYRIFISHLSESKMSASGLKNSLMKYGITSFVAHEDIEPSQQWQIEIEKGLYTMDALCAILESDFIKSPWCDQEVGWAMGRDVVCIPISKKQMPYGFLGKVQAIKVGEGMTVAEVAKKVFEAICNNEKSRAKYLQILSDILLNSKFAKDAQNWMEIINEVPSLSSADLNYINQYASENTSLMKPFVLSRLNILFNNVGLEEIEIEKKQTTYVYDASALPF